MALLSDAKARSIKPDDKPIPHGGITGLTLHPSTTKGRGKWVFRYVSPVTGKRRNAGLGIYPEISIAEAGNQARLMREQLARGLDPLEIKKEEASKPAIPTVEIAARQVHEQLLPGWRNPKHGKQWISTLEQYAFPIIGRQPINAITPAHIASVLQPIWLEIPETATRVKQRLHAVMAWAWAHSFCQANPVDVVDKLLPLQPSKAIRTQHQPAMDWRILPEFYREHLANAERFDVSRALLSFVILTACRSGEARSMRWEELDLDAAIWTIPADRMKTQVTHRVPLSVQAITVLEKVQGDRKSVV